MEEYKVKISYEDNTVTINDQQPQIAINLVSDPNSKARLCETISVPSGTIKTVQLQIHMALADTGKTILLSPSAKLAELHLTFLDCLVSINVSSVWVQIANLTSNAIKIFTQTAVADMQVISSADIRQIDWQNIAKINHLQKAGKVYANTTKQQSVLQDINFDLSSSNLSENEKQNC